MKLSIGLSAAIAASANVVAAVPTARSAAVLEPKAKRDVNIPDYVQKFKGTTYTPFDQNKNCRTEDQIKTDLSVLKDFSIVRLYSADCNVIQYAAETINGKLILAVNDVQTQDGINADIQAIKDQIGAAGKSLNDAVDTIVVGNELVYNNWFEPSQVQSFISEARSALNGYTGNVISAETVSSFYGHPELCEYSDYLGINNHPFFDNQSAEQAGEYVLSHIEAVAAFCSEHGHDKKVVTLETGWPWKGDHNGPAYPSSENQVTAVKGISDKAGDASILYAAYNELWKDDSVWAVEKNWGMLGNAPSAW